MPNNAMPYQNNQSPAIPSQKQSQGDKSGANAANAKGEPVKREPNDHPNQMDKGSGTKEAFENEGEGSRSAARSYDKATEQYVKSGRVDAAAKSAEEALEGPEGASLRQAEEKARATAPAAPKK
jgi:hypothetical protein